MAIPEEWYDAPIVLPKDKSKWVRGPIYEAVPKLKAMHAGRLGVGAQKRDRMGQLEQQVAELRRELDELRKGIAAAAQPPREPAAAGE